MSRVKIGQVESTFFNGPLQRRLRTTALPFYLYSSRDVRYNSVLSNIFKNG